MSGLWGICVSECKISGVRDLEIGGLCLVERKSEVALWWVLGPQKFFVYLESVLKDFAGCVHLFVLSLGGVVRDLLIHQPLADQGKTLGAVVGCGEFPR